ncbi:hypothetical protein J4470_00630 [Candidatus Woesearchaeota archaeon]|nr:hypothetical protein [Candidatus Woesearchaeota archaeon]
MTNQSHIQAKITELRSLRDGWKDEIPATPVHAVWGYKCTNGWFQSWYAQLSILKRHGLLLYHLEQRWVDFRSRYQERQNTDVDTREGFLVKREDVDFGNQMISDVIESLENRLQQQEY